MTHRLPAYGLAVALLLAGAPLQADDFLAYAVLNGKTQPLPEHLDAVPTKHLVKIRWGRYSGKKARVGVLKVDNTSSASSVNISGPGGSYSYNFNTGGVPVQGIEAILIDVLNQTGRFRVVERTVLNQTLREQDLGASGRISKPSAAKIGKVLGAQYLIQAVVTHYEPNYQGQRFGVGGLLPGKVGGILGGVGVNTSRSMVGMNFRLIDAQTSEIVFSKQVEAIISRSGLTVGGAGFGHAGTLGGFFSSYARTPIGQAVIAAVNKGVYELVKQVGNAPAWGSVVKVKGGRVYLNLGRGQVAAGDRLKVLRKGEALVDPETGLSLGSEDRELGTVVVTEVKQKYSIARAEGARGIRRGDKVVATRAAGRLLFARSWQGPGPGDAGAGDAEEEEF